MFSSPALLRIVICEMRNYLLYFLAIFCLSQSAHWVKWAGVSVTLLGFWRLALATSFWLALNLAREKNWRVFAAPEKFGAWIWSVVAGILLFLHLWSFQWSAQHISIANLMVIFASNPLWTAAMTILFFEEKWSPRLGLAYALSITGLMVLLGHKLQFDPANIYGDGIALLSAILFSMYLVASHRARLAFTNTQFSLILYAVSALSFLIYVLLDGQNIMPDAPKTWIAIGGLFVMSTILGHSVFSYLLKFLNINFMSLGKLLEPMLATFTAYFLFGEKVELGVFLAFALTASGVFVLVLQKKKAGV